MRFWDRVRGWVGARGVDSSLPDEGEHPAEVLRARDAPLAGATQPRGEHTVASAEPSASDLVAADLQRLSSLALGRLQETEAVEIVRRLRGTVAEADAVARVAKAIAGRPGNDGLRVACADILAVRGDEEGALRLLEGTTSTSALMLAADLYAARGQIARAVVTVERVLARDIDAPGAMERFRRLRALLGAAPAVVRRLDEATALASAPTSHSFRLLREVARGGAGVVYEAEDELLGRRVAFKVYHGRGDDRAALLREVRVAEALAGAGIVRVFDADPSAGWVALEWAPRGSLREALRGPEVGALYPIDAWARALARSLARVHGKGYVHGDVKPANVLLRRSGEPVLSDFGIARRIGETSEGGSPGYVAPERLAGAPFAETDDVYGFGRVLEDVVHKLEGRVEGSLEPYRQLALRCIGERAQRPSSGAALSLEIEAIAESP